MNTILKLLILFISLALLEFACEDSIVIEQLSEDLGDQEEEFEEEERIFVIDRTGKKWDITHAVNNYDFEPERFQFGLGPQAIPPILNPQMVCPGEEGYPADNESFTIMGASLNGHTRAYRLTVMTRHEVVDEKFGDAHVAVAY